MKSFLARTTAATLFLLVTAHFSKATSRQIPAVQSVRLPHGGIQPQVVTDTNGWVHVVYFAGDSSHGDLFYIRSKDGGATFSSPIRVNSQQGSAIAVGNIRGARIALGRNSRIHVVWNGSGSAEPRTSDGREPMLYSRLDADANAFEPQRNLIHAASGIDGGGALAADRLGNVFVFWHAPLIGRKDEANRRVWVARSTDDGATFAAERIAFAEPTGVCGCCGMSAFADSRGTVLALFRSAHQIVNRDMYLLTSNDHGRTFHGTKVSKWNVGYCVMSSEAFAESASSVFAAWESEKQILYARIDPKTGATASPVSAPGTGINRKYPALAVNPEGFILLAWAEGMNWKKGGSASWQVLDPFGKPVGEIGHANGVPAWGLVAAFAAADGTFRLIY